MCVRVGLRDGMGLRVRVQLQMPVHYVFRQVADCACVRLRVYVRVRVRLCMRVRVQEFVFCVPNHSFALVIASENSADAPAPPACRTAHLSCPAARK